MGETTEVQLQNLNEVKDQNQDSNQTTAAVINTEGQNDPRGQVEQTTNTVQSESSIMEGSDNPVFDNKEEQKGFIEEIPPLTYIDFLPRLLLKAGIKGQAPTYARFSTLVEQANQWLQGNTDYTAWKCETVIFKLETDDKIQADGVHYLESAFGITKFVMGLRVWLIPRTNNSLPAVQIGYTTALPGKQTSEIDNLETGHLVNVSIYDSLQETINNMNKQLIKRPIPGSILNMETVTFRKSQETSQKEAIDPDCTCWAENGNLSRLYVYGFRIFYVHGNPEFEKIGFHDQLPDFTQSPTGVSIKFNPFKDAVALTSAWLQQQKGIRIVNMQTVNIRIGSDPNSAGRIRINTDSSGHIELGFVDTRYAKVLRTFYVASPKIPKDTSYSSVDLHTRLFVPVLREGTSKSFESFSKTMQRVIKWMTYTRIPPFCVETVQYQIYLGGYGDVVKEDRVDTNVSRSNGRNQLTTVRLYLPSDFVEPPPEISPEVDTAGESGWGCVIS